MYMSIKLVWLTVKNRNWENSTNLVPPPRNHEVLLQKFQTDFIDHLRKFSYLSKNIFDDLIRMAQTSRPDKFKERQNESHPSSAEPRISPNFGSQSRSFGNVT